MPPYIDLNFNKYEPEEIDRIKTEPRLLDVIRLFENIKSGTRARLAEASFTSLVAATTTPGEDAPTLESAIKRALTNDQITAGIQPYRKLSSPDLRETNPLLSEIQGCEALMKMIVKKEESEEATLKRAGEVIKVSDKTHGLTSQIDLAVLKNASLIIRIINELRRRINLDPIPIAFNCSVDLVNRENFANDVLTTLDNAGTPHGFCTIEILEYIKDLNKNQIAQFKKLADAGVHIAIDDFDQRINGGEETDIVLRKLKEAGVQILRLKIDGKTTHTIYTDEGRAKIEKIINIAIANNAESIVFEGGYDNLTTVTIEHLKVLERKYDKQIAFFVEGTVVDAVGEFKK